MIKMARLKHSDKKILGVLKLERKTSGEELSATELRKKADISSSVFSKCKDRLVDEGLIEVRDGEQDSRRKFFRLTEEGTARTGLKHILSVSDEVVFDSEQLFGELEEARDYVVNELSEDDEEITWGDVNDVFGRAYRAVFSSVKFEETLERANRSVGENGEEGNSNRKEEG